MVKPCRLHGGVLSRSVSSVSCMNAISAYRVIHLGGKLFICESDTIHCGSQPIRKTTHLHLFQYVKYQNTSFPFIIQFCLYIYTSFSKQNCHLENMLVRTTKGR